MTQSFHAGATPSPARPIANRRRTDITPTITPRSRTDNGMGYPLSSRDSTSRNTPTRKMWMSASNGKSPGKAVSMSRLDQLARPRVLNLNQSKATTPSENSPSHAPLSLTTNARLNHRRGRLEQSPSKKISASMSHLNGPSFCGTPAPKLRQRTRPPLSASASMRTRSKTGSIDEEGRVIKFGLILVAFKSGSGSSYGWHYSIQLTFLVFLLVEVTTFCTHLRLQIRHNENFDSLIYSIHFLSLLVLIPSKKCTCYLICTNNIRNIFILCCHVQYF